MFSPDVKKYSRRTALAVGGSVVAYSLLPNFSVNQVVEAQEKPYVIALHGYNGSTTSGFIGGLKNYLNSRGVECETPELPGEMNPNRDEWEDIILKRIQMAPRPPILVAYSLSVIAALGVLSNPGVEVEKFRSVSGRKIRPALPNGFPKNLADFYGGGVNPDQIIKNSFGGRLVIHSRDDQVVGFENNAQELASQLQAETYFVDGMGHFDQSMSQGAFELQARRIAMS
jgi:predicted alpha/beta hydrolase family esterase